MQVLFLQDGGEVHVELVSENEEERQFLIRAWKSPELAISCEEWREIAEQAKTEDG